MIGKPDESVKQVPQISTYGPQISTSYTDRVYEFKRIASTSYTDCPHALRRIAQPGFFQQSVARIYFDSRGLLSQLDRFDRCLACGSENDFS